jgi:hypothetical protein
MRPYSKVFAALGHRNKFNKHNNIGLQNMTTLWAAKMFRNSNSSRLRQHKATNISYISLWFTAFNKAHQLVIQPYF